MCEEMAGDEITVPILLGLGVDEYSMSATSILKDLSLKAKEGHEWKVDGL